MAWLSVHLHGTPTATQKGAEPTGTVSLKTSKVCTLRVAGLPDRSPVLMCLAGRTVCASKHRRALEIAGIDLKGKPVAVFGLGDAVGYSEYFCDAMEEIYSTFKATGAKMIGHWPADGYEHEGSKVLPCSRQSIVYFIYLAINSSLHAVEVYVTYVTV